MSYVKRTTTAIQKISNTTTLRNYLMTAQNRVTTVESQLRTANTNLSNERKLVGTLRTERDNAKRSLAAEQKTVKALRTERDNAKRSLALESSGKVVLQSQISTLTNDFNLIKQENSLLRKNRDKIDADLKKEQRAKASLEKLLNDRRIEKDSIIKEKDKISKSLVEKVKRAQYLENKLKKSPTPLTVEKIPQYFKTIVEEFDKSLKTNDASPIEYAIGSIDVDMKAHLVTNNGKPEIATPNLENIEAEKDTLSSLKFSIRPMPKKRN